MSVVEFSADAWQASSPGLQSGLARRLGAVSELAQGLGALAGSEKITGQGADAMRAYIREVHGPILQSLQIALTTFQTAIGVYWNGYAQVDTGGNFRLVRDELEAHLTQLEAGIGGLRGVVADLRKISGDASHLVSLGGAGASAAERCVDDLDRMHATAKGLKETWEAYEASDHGFAQVRELIAELHRIISNIGALTVGQGRSYTAGSFQLTADGLGKLTSGMVEYCKANQDAATKGWEKAFEGFQDDLDAAEKARREQAGWDLLWDGLQVLAGAVVTVVGLGLTPFTGGFSLGLTALGGAMVIGGINNGINHYSIATTGQEFNLAGMAATWIDTNLAKPVAAVSPFTGGVISGVGSALTGMAQFSVKDTAAGVSALITDQAARDALWNQLVETGAKVISGDWYTAGQIVGELVGLIIPGAVAAKAGRAAGLFGKVGALAKPGEYLPGVKPIGTPGAVARTVEDIRDRAAGAQTVKGFVTPGERPAWTPHPDNPPKPGDADYGHPIPDHGVHRPYPTVNDVNRRTFDLVTDHDAPWGRDTNGTPFIKAEYDQRFTEATIDSETGAHWDHYPPNDGAVPGTRRDYHDLAAFLRDHGNAVDRIGEPTGPYLGVMRDRLPASFEERGLPVNSLEKPYYSYRLAESWPPGTEGWSIEISDVDRAFGRDGGAQQILIRDEEGNKVLVQRLLKEGILLPGGGNK